MSDIVIEKKRVRVSAETFLQAVRSSSTYAELAAKTGQKLNSTIAKYNRLRKDYESRGESLPKMERAKK